VNAIIIDHHAQAKWRLQRWQHTVVDSNFLEKGRLPPARPVRLRKTTPLRCMPVYKFPRGIAASGQSAGNAWRRKTRIGCFRAVPHLPRRTRFWPAGRSPSARQATVGHRWPDGQDKISAELSGGQQQRVAWPALWHPAELILLDSLFPTSCRPAPAVGRGA
jgi:hypothetical protein